MEPTTMGDVLTDVLSSAPDEVLADHVKDPGLLGEIVRSTLQSRGHAVHYSNVNGVQEGGVVLTSEAEAAQEPRGDSADVATAPLQTTEQQAEGVDEIDPEYAAGVQETATPTDEESASEGE